MIKLELTKGGTHKSVFVRVSAACTDKNPRRAGIGATQPRLSVMCVLAFSISAISSSAQVATTRPVAFRPPVIRVPEYPKTTKIPNDVLDPNGRDVIVLPSEPVEHGEDITERSSGAIAKLPVDAHRLPEGYVVAGRTARIEHRDRWYLAHIEPGHGLPSSGPLRILPNTRLAMLEAMLAQSDERKEFVVTGRVTEFQGANYILIETLIEQNETAEAPQSTPSETTSANGTDSQAAQEPTAEEVVKRLMEIKPRRAVVLPEQSITAGEDTTSAAAGTSANGEMARWSEDTVLVDRVGRIVAGDQWWLLAFDDPGLGPKPKPIFVLPNQLLETAMALTGGGTRPVALIISGEITAHKGTNYLLLRKVLVRRDLGNFR